MSITVWKKTQKLGRTQGMQKEKMNNHNYVRELFVQDKRWKGTPPLGVEGGGCFERNNVGMLSWENIKEK